MAESEPVTGEVGEEEESEYSYVYETDSEYSYYTESEGEEGQGEDEPSPALEPGEESNESTGGKSEHDAAEVSNSNEDGDEEDENEALRRHKQQLEKFKPKIPDYVKSPEPCAFSDDPAIWIAWMEDQVNKEKNRRMELIMQEQEEDEVKEEESVSPVMEVEQQDSPMDCHNTEAEACEDSMEETKGEHEETDHNMQTDDHARDDCQMVIDSPDNNNNNIEAEEDSEWEWEYEEEEGEEAQVCMSLTLNQQEPCAQEVGPESEACGGDNLDNVDESGGERDQMDSDRPEATEPAGESDDALKQGCGRLTLDKQMSLPAENRRSELVPKDMQEKLDFIRKKKAEAASGQCAAPGENPTHKSAVPSLLDEETKRKLAFIKQNKKGASSSELDSTNDGIKLDPNDPLDPETRRKLEFVRKNKKNSAPTKSSDNEEMSGLSSPAPAAPHALLRQQSNPEGARAGARPTSLAEQYGDDSNLNDMLARIKTLREERKQILQDMNAIKTAFNGGSKSDSADVTDDGIETGESTPCTEISAPFKEAQGPRRRRSIDSGIGTKSLSSVQGGSPTEELDAISETSTVGASHPGKKKISKEEKEHTDGTFYCFLCGENLGKMSKGTVMHMGLEDGEPVCPDALYLTDESKEKIMAIGSTKTFTYEAKYQLLDTMELETWDLEYDIPTGDLMEKVDAFLIDVEVQKQRDAEKFEAMRNGAIDEIFMEEFKELLSEKCSASLERSAARDVSGREHSECDNVEKCDNSVNIASGPAPPPPPPPSSSVIPAPVASKEAKTPAFTNVLKSIRDGDHRKLKPTETDSHSEIAVGQVIHKHLAPRVFTREVRSLVKDITKDDHKRRLKKVKTNDKSAPFIPDDVEIYFYGGQNANKALPPPPLSKVKEEYNPCKKRYEQKCVSICSCFLRFRIFIWKCTLDNGQWRRVGYGVI